MDKCGACKLNVTLLESVLGIYWAHEASGNQSSHSPFYHRAYVEGGV